MAGIIDNYSEANQVTDFTISGVIVELAQSFTGNGSTLGSAKLYLKKSGAPTGNATLVIYAHTGVYGSSGAPTGAALATSDNFDVSTLTTSYQLITFTFSGANQITLGNGTHYFASYKVPATTTLLAGVDISSPSHPGNAASFNSTSWTIRATTDMCFYVYDNTQSMMFNDYQFLKAPDGISVGGDKIR